MARVKLNFPADKPICIVYIPIRISDLNYGNHLGNDAVLSLAHEARVQFLAKYGLSELEVGGAGLIMSDAAIVYKSEGHYGEIVCIEIFVTDVGRHSFDLLYRMTVDRNGGKADLAHVKTGMVCFDYTCRKVASIPQGLQDVFEGRSHLS